MAKDLIHNLIKEALITDGWLITHDPYPIKVGGFDMEIDLGAEDILAAERANQKIAIEPGRRCGQDFCGAFKSI